MKKNTAPEQIHFVPVGFVVENVFKGGSYSISGGYSDSTGQIKDSTANSGSKGRYVEYIGSKDAKGIDKAKRFRFDQSIGRIQTRPSDTDIYGKSQYHFLKNHPECEGSPNGIYEEDGQGNKIQVGVTFRELNSAKDAKQALLSDKLRNKAESAALALEGGSVLEEIANINGYFGDIDDFMLLKVVEYAKKNPAEFLSTLESEDRTYKALVKKALSEKLFRMNGPMIKWDNLIVGNDELDAIAYLRKNKDMVKALQEKLGIDLVDTSSKKSSSPVK
jgi:hypothetical protein